MKKILSLLICASMVLPTAANVYAEENVITIDNVTYDCGSMTVSGNVMSDNGNSAANKAVTIKLAEDRSDPDLIAVLDEVKTDENGAFKITAKLPDEKDGLDEDGVVTLYVKAPNVSELYEQSAYYIKKSERSKVIDDLSEKTSASDMAEALGLQKVKSTLAVIGVEMSYFDKLSGTKIAEVLAVSNAFADKSEQAVKKAVNGALWVADVNSGNSDDVLKIWNPVFRETAFNDIEDENKKKELAENLDKGKSYANFDELEKAYLASNVIYDINRARSGEIEELLDLASECGLNDTSYSSYKSMDYSKKTAVGDALVKSISQSKVYTIAQLNTALASALTAANNVAQKPGGTVSGGSVSSNGKGTITDIANGTKTDTSKITAPVNEVTLTDMDSAEWAREAVWALAKRGIVSGYDDGTFRPNNGVKREEFVKMLSSAIGMSDGARCSFDDVPESAWYYPAVAFCTEKKIVNGISENKFGTGMEITRQDMATIVYRAAVSADKNLSSVREYKAFDDESSIGTYALEAVKTLYGAGKLNGVSGSMFLPNNTCTRAQVAKIIYDVFVNKSLPIDETAQNSLPVSSNTSAENISADAKKINYNSKAIGVLEGLDIAAGYTSDNFDESAVVTAGRFINMLLNVTSDSGYTGDTVSDEGLQKAGFFGFVGTRADAEEKSITYGNAVKMVLDLLGYQVMAESNGGFPGGYVKAASSSGLELKSIGWEEKLTAGAAADLIYSAIKANPLNAKLGSEGLSYESASGENILEFYRNIHVITGLMDRNSITYLTDGNLSRRKCIGIGGEEYAVNDYLYDDLLGYNVEAYIKIKDGEESTLLYAMPNKSKNKVMTLDLSDVEDAADNLSNVKYRENDRASLKTANLSAALKVIYNQKSYSRYTKEDFLNKNGSLTLIDNDNDGTYDVAKIDAYEVMVVKSVDSKGVISGKFTYDGALKKLVTEDMDVTVISGGSETNVKSLKEFDVINIYHSKQTEDAYIKIVANGSKITGTISGIDTENDEKHIIVGDKNYKLTNSLKTALDKKDTEVKEMSIGSEYDIYLDAFGDAAWIAETSNVKSYGYLRNIFADESGSEIRIELLTTENEWLKLSCADKIKYNGTSLSRKDFFATNTIEPQIIEYKVNQNAEITSLNTASLGAYDPKKFTTNGKQNARYCRGDYAFDSRMFLNDGAKIFILPGAVEEGALPDQDSCGVVSASYLLNEKYYDYQAYNYDKYGYADVFAVYTTLDNFKPTGQTPLFLVESKKDVSADGTVLTMVNGASAGSKLSVSAEADDHIFDDIEKGDIISVTAGLSGDIYVQKYYDYTEDGSNDTEDLTINEWDEKRCGVLKEIDMSKKRLIIGSDATRTMRWFDNISVSIYDAERDEVTIGSLADLQEGDYLWIRLAWRQIKEVVAIRHK